MAKRNTDYGEIFCEAVQNIVNGEVSKLSYDISRECTVVEVIDKAFGKYRVSDGSINFIALASQGAFYEVNDTVLVTIPQGDYNKQINIVNKIVDEWSGPAGFVRPLDTMVKCTDNLVIGATSEKLIANGETKSKSILSLSQKKLLGFTKIGIAAKFKSLVDEALEGDYGLKFTITADKDKVVEFLFSCADMLGNPYKFTSWFSQEYAFDIPNNFQKVTGITVSFYQNSNFKDGNNNYLPVSEVNNLFVEDLEIYFGYDKDIDFKEIVEIFSDDLTYAGKLGDNEETKEISLQWIHKVGENRLQQITNINKNDNYHIKWYRFTPGCKKADDYVGENWELLKKGNNKFTFKGSVRATRPTEKFKAICFVDTYPLINDPTYKVVEYYSSNILTFENTNQETSGGELAADVIQNNLSFRYSDGMFGNYFLYDQNGFLIDSANQGTSKNRTVEICYKNTEINEDSEIYNLASYKWTVPDLKKQPFSMIVYDEDQSLETNKFNYSINNSYNSNFTDNNISCTITINNQDYVLNDVLRFGPRGSNGTNNTFFIEMLDGKNAVTIGDTNGLRLQAILIDPSGKQIYFTSEEAKNISWEIINDDKKYLKKDESGQVITLTTTCTTVPTDHYAILKASYEYKTGEKISPTLEAYLPIPIKSNTCKSMIGTNQILYNHQGIPKYGNTAYVAINNSNKESYDWKIAIDDENPNSIRLKSLKDDKKGLVVNSQLYCKRENNNDAIQDKVCVFCEELWSQPILVMQTQYDFAMLNSWDGELTIDDKNGTILSTMLGAGRKNSQNKFSGVLIGDIRGGSGLQPTEHKTGVYGFQDGVMSYGLREDGTAFFGASGKGRIEIDGNSGVIKSADWTRVGENGWTIENSTGALLDFDDGILLLKGDRNSYLYFNENRNGLLKLALPGSNVIISDKGEEGTALDGYIDSSIYGIVSEFRRTSAYYATSNTVDSQGTKVLNLINFKTGFANNTGDDGNTVEKLTINNIIEEGNTLAVTFEKAETVTETKEEIKDGNTVTGYEIAREGQALSLKIVDPEDATKTVTKNIWINGAKTSKTNPFGWNAGSTVYFIFKNDHWEVTDGGSYSRITQTADSIISEVSAIGGSVSSKVSQTASEIRSEVTDATKGLESKISQTAGEIIGKVVSQKGGVDTGFSWNLLGDYFSLNSYINNKKTEVFRCDKNGVTIQGKVTATSGKIGDCEIKDGKLTVPSANIGGLAATYATITSLKATNARVGTIESDYIKTAQLNATNARISTIEGDYIKTNQLNATNARISTIESDYITANKLSAHTISADKITTGKLQNAITLDGNGIIYAGDLMLGSGGLSTVGGLPFITISNGVIGSFSKLNVNTIASNGNNSITFNNTIYVPNQSYISIGGTTLYNYITGIVGQMRP